MSGKNLLSRPTVLSIFKICSYPALWRAVAASVFSIFKNFFYLQYKAVLFPRKYPLSAVDHALDDEIPFKPDKVSIYMDFSSFWIRVQGFLLQTFGEKAIPAVQDFILSIGALYDKAAEIYTDNMSTTKRPSYYGKFKFILIHLFDPHLMCIPSLHVMVVIRVYTKLRQIVRELSGPDAALLEGEIEKVRAHALAITESILYVKQHSVNCIAAAMYTMTRFESALFPPEEAAAFTEALFHCPDDLDNEIIIKIKKHIRELYRQFLHEGETAADWRAPLFDFLRPLRVRQRS